MERHDSHSLRPLPRCPSPQYAALTISRRRFLKGTAGMGVCYLAPITLAAAPPPRQQICLSSDANIIVLADQRQTGIEKSRHNE